MWVSVLLSCKNKPLKGFFLKKKNWKSFGMVIAYKNLNYLGLRYKVFIPLG